MLRLFKLFLLGCTKISCFGHMFVSPPCDMECRNSFRYEIMPLAVAFTTITHTKKDKNYNVKQVFTKKLGKYIKVRLFQHLVSA